MSAFGYRGRCSLKALLLALCCTLTGGASLAEAQSNALPPEDVVRRPEYGRFAVSEKYAYELLDAALEHSVERFGPYRAEPLVTETLVARLREEAVKGDLVNVLVRPPVIDAEMIPIDIPLDKGLLGYRVAFIRANDQERVAQVRDIDGLKQLRVGNGEQWFDTAILEHNNLDVVTGKELGPLFQMLERGRFDLLPRGVSELLPEYDHYVKGSPRLAIDQHLLIHYPYAKYAYVSQSAPRLAQRIRYGLEEMQKDGSFDRLFDRHFAQLIADLRLGRRTLIELDNPSLPAWAKIPRLDLR